jgi:hypothetical protein
MPALTNYCLSGCQSSLKAYSVYLDAGAHKCLLILDGEACKNFVYLDAGMLLAEWLRSQIRYLKSGLTIASGNSGFKWETLPSQFCIRSYKKTF